MKLWEFVESDETKGFVIECELEVQLLDEVPGKSNACYSEIHGGRIYQKKLELVLRNVGLCNSCRWTFTTDPNRKEEARRLILDYIFHQTSDELEDASAEFQRLQLKRSQLWNKLAKNLAKLRREQHITRIIKGFLLTTPVPNDFAYAILESENERKLDMQYCLPSDPLIASNILTVGQPFEIHEMNIDGAITTRYVTYVNPDDTKRVTIKLDEKHQKMYDKLMAALDEEERENKASQTIRGHELGLVNLPPDPDRHVMIPMHPYTKPTTRSKFIVKLEERERLTIQLEKDFALFNGFFQSKMNGKTPNETADCGLAAIAVLCLNPEIGNMNMLRAWWKDRPEQIAFSHACIASIEMPSLWWWLDSDGKFDTWDCIPYCRRYISNRENLSELHLCKQSLIQAARYWIHGSDDVAFKLLHEFGEYIRNNMIRDKDSPRDALKVWHDYEAAIKVVEDSVASQEKEPWPDTQLFSDDVHLSSSEYSIDPTKKETDTNG